MSVHNDGPASFQAPIPPPPLVNPNQLGDEWRTPIEVKARALLKHLIENHDDITSLAFKIKLRQDCVSLEPAAKIVQEDVSRFLKLWFMGLDRDGKESAKEWKDVGGAGPEASYAFREHFTDDGKKYNEYFWSSAAREDETEMEDAIVQAQVTGEAKPGGVLAWIKRRFGVK